VKVFIANALMIAFVILEKMTAFAVIICTSTLFFIFLHKIVFWKIYFFKISINFKNPNDNDSSELVSI
jgi:hypothetical protein